MAQLLLLLLLVLSGAYSWRLLHLALLQDPGFPRHEVLVERLVALWCRQCVCATLRGGSEYAYTRIVTHAEDLVGAIDAREPFTVDAERRHFHRGAVQRYAVLAVAAAPSVPSATAQALALSLSLAPLMRTQ